MIAGRLHPVKPFVMWRRAQVFIADGAGSTNGSVLRRLPELLRNIHSIEHRRNPEPVQCGRLRNANGGTSDEDVIGGSFPHGAHRRTQARHRELLDRTPRSWYHACSPMGFASSRLQCRMIPKGGDLRRPSSVSHRIGTGRPRTGPTPGSIGPALARDTRDGHTSVR
jgi:hypothetical protein